MARTDAGRTVKTTERNLYDPSQIDAPAVDYFDGDGTLAKHTVNFGSTTPAPKTSYFVRSSLLNKVVTETTGTGAKSKTYAPANGTTVAVQTVWVNQGTPTETLTFTHHDASATGAQETDASGNLLQTSPRTAEYDPLGRNIADPGPYTTLDTEPPPDDSGISLFPPAEGYRPGRNTYSIDGLPVSESQFAEAINSGLIGGAFGLVEMAARMSARIEAYRVEYGYFVRGNSGGPPVLRMGGGFPTGGLFDAQERIITGFGGFITPIYNSTWSTVASLAPIAQQQTQPTPLSGADKTKWESERDRLLKMLAFVGDKGKSDCRKFLEKMGFA